MSDATDALLESFVRAYEPVTSLDPEPSFTVDTSGTVEVATRMTLGRLASTGILPAAARRAR